MTCYQAKYPGELKPNAEVEYMDWFDYSKRGLVSPVDQLIFDDLKEKGLID
jgi:8-oxo-dGTP diphosphatase